MRASEEKLIDMSKCFCCFLGFEFQLGDSQKAAGVELVCTHGRDWNSVNIMRRGSRAKFTLISREELISFKFTSDVE